MLFEPHSMTTFFNCGGKAVSVTCHRTCSKLSPRMQRLINPSPKRFFCALLTPETWHNWVSYYYAINVVMFNVETVIVVNFKPVIIVNAFRRN